MAAARFLGWAALSAAALALALPSAAAAQAPGSLVQLAPPSACLNSDGTLGCAAYGGSLFGWGDDGGRCQPRRRHVYPTFSNGGEVRLARDLSSGAVSAIGAGMPPTTTAIALAPAALTSTSPTATAVSPAACASETETR